VSWRLIVKKSFIRDLKGLDPNVRNRIIETIDEIVRNPYAGKKLDNFYSWRIGDYRIIYTIDKERRAVVLLWVGHRRSIYRRLRY